MTQVIPRVDVSTQPIELCKLLKIANMVGGGGEAKIVISEGYVLLNNQVEFQKRKKIYHDDIIEFNGEVIQVNYIEQKTIEPSKALHKVAKKKITAKNPKNSGKQAISHDSTAPKAAKRKPISF
ncbi:ribosome-associated protein [Colwellia chukchiensis]|uniref:Ribosome-associated protein n=1 Tax=Colwellia chukchiensis TaxID=641665 RepID=A0A1H7M326_9GAMM|nr:RNA-binding S4 domain-containing protein [Colwellia chukchiensis]SEL05604.1 ribosome-associated protein [Colwellia chukchiensis]